ncbi:T-cell receptor beta-1 chain C region [Scomber scombrus]|uniref:T-cell receptor beta-1 chain C region n=1 Tax=Scomber scombrus TaxID=13677 RepID=UPI002DD7D796|nr:T-cell receptor beta-1 chain C region [Scomber scombrus]
MISGITTLTFCTLWAAVVSQTVLITQWPQYISSLSSVRAEIHCYQNNTDHQYLYWYRQKERSVQLVVAIVGSTVNFEDEFKTGFETEASNVKQWSLIISGVERKDEAVYLCAASEHSDAYFGAGTKLTVLDPDKKPTPPSTVKVLSPSQDECSSQKDQKKKKTLVCVASGFYPDHVSVVWQIDGENIINGSATDNTALKNDNGYYSITSRLRVPAATWFTPGKNFTCIVSFSDETKTSNHTAYVLGVQGVEGKGRLMTRETYLKTTQTLKLSYGVFIAKSCVYGAFVVFLVWKLQSSSGKHTK